MNPAASLVEPWWAKVFNHTAKNVTVAEAADKKFSEEKQETFAEEYSSDVTGLSKLEKKRKSKRQTSKRKEERRRSETTNVADQTQKNDVSESNSVNAHIASISRSLYLGSFTKGSTLQSGKSLQKTAGNDETAEDQNAVRDEPRVNPIDEKLWKSCEGRTAHKGARYGVLKGKMARIIRQEEAMAARHVTLDK